MAFSVEWLKDDVVIHDQPMMGGTLDDALRAAIELTDDVIKETGQRPQEIRIFDFLELRGITYPLTDRKDG